MLGFYHGIIPHIIRSLFIIRQSCRKYRICESGQRVSVFGCNNTNTTGNVVQFIIISLKSSFVKGIYKKFSLKFKKSIDKGDMTR